MTWNPDMSAAPRDEMTEIEKLQKALLTKRGADGGIDPDCYNAQKMLSSLLERVEKAEKRAVELEGALKPFADEAEKRWRIGPDADHYGIGKNALTRGDLHKAAVALKKEPRT